MPDEPKLPDALLRGGKQARPSAVALHPCAKELKPILLPIGKVPLGRGPILDLHDTRVSRKQAGVQVDDQNRLMLVALNQTVPLKVRRAGTPTWKKFPFGQKTLLRHGDAFCLLADFYEFVVQVGGQELPERVDEGRGGPPAQGRPPPGANDGGATLAFRPNTRSGGAAAMQDRFASAPAPQRPANDKSSSDREARRAEREARRAARKAEKEKEKKGGSKKSSKSSSSSSSSSSRKKDKLEKGTSRKSSSGRKKGSKRTGSSSPDPSKPVKEDVDESVTPIEPIAELELEPQLELEDPPSDELSLEPEPEELSLEPEAPEIHVEPNTESDESKEKKKKRLSKRLSGQDLGGGSSSSLLRFGDEKVPSVSPGRRRSGSSASSASTRFASPSGRFAGNAQTMAARPSRSGGAMELADRAGRVDPIMEELRKLNEMLRAQGQKELTRKEMSMMRKEMLKAKRQKTETMRMKRKATNSKQPIGRIFAPQQEEQPEMVSVTKASIDRRNKEIEELRQTIVALEKENQVNEKKVQDMLFVVHESEENAKKQAELVADLENDIEAQGEFAAEARSEFLSVEKKLKEMEGVNAQLEAKLARKKAKIQRMKTSVLDIQEEGALAKGELIELRFDLDDIKEERAEEKKAWQKERSENELEVKRLSSRIEELEHEQGELESKLESTEKRTESLKAKIVKGKEEISEMQKEIETLRAGGAGFADAELSESEQVKQLAHAANVVLKEKKALEANVAQLTEELAESKAQVEKLSERIDSLKSRVSKSNEELEEALKEKHDTEEKMNDVLHEHDQLNTVVKDMEKKQQEADKAHAKDVEEAQLKAEKAQRKLDDSVAALEAANVRVGELEKEIEELSANDKRREQEVKTKTHELEQQLRDEQEQVRKLTAQAVALGLAPEDMGRAPQPKAAPAPPPPPPPSAAGGPPPPPPPQSGFKSGGGAPKAPPPPKASSSSGDSGGSGGGGNIMDELKGGAKNLRKGSVPKVRTLETNAPPSGNIFDEMKRVQLKKVMPEDLVKETKLDDRDSMMSQIRAGVKLRRAEDRELEPEAEVDDGSMFSILSKVLMQRRTAVKVEGWDDDSDDDMFGSDTDTDDEAWEYEYENTLDENDVDIGF